VTWLVGQRVQSADIQINPPQLGPVEVRITIKDDQASLFFTSQHAAVREAIQAALPRLNEMLAQGGLSLGQTSVGAESFAGQQQASRDGHGGRRQEPEVSAGLAGAISAAVPGDLTVLRGRVGVDMFV
jgi:flagellar hook-length control protein FliK